MKLKNEEMEGGWKSLLKQTWLKSKKIEINT